MASRTLFNSSHEYFAKYLEKIFIQLTFSYVSIISETGV